MSTTVDTKKSDIAPVEYSYPQLCVKGFQKIYSWSPRKDKSATLFSYAIIFLSSFLMRVINIGISDDGAPIFDEKHYVTQAEQITHLGIENNPSYGLVVHPFLGKKIMSLGIDIFGYNPLGWRIMSIIAGCLMVVMVFAIVKAFTNNWFLSILSVILLNVEGVVFSMSRIGMLDIFIGFFSLLGCTFIAFRIARKIPLYSPVLPIYKDLYLLSAGICFGLASSVKISGFYFAASAGIILSIISVYQVVKDKNIIRCMSSIAVGFVYFAIVPVVVFFAMWTPWFKDYFSVYRNDAEFGLLEYELPGFLRKILPDSLENFYSYQRGVLDFHTELTNSAGNIHPWESKPHDWLLGNGSLLFYTGGDSQIWISTNRSIWILSSLILIVSAFMFFIKKNMQWGFVFGGFLAAFIPWLFSYDRQMYIFYLAPLAPFVVVGIILLIQGLYKYGFSEEHVGKHESTETIKKTITLRKISSSMSIVLTIMMVSAVFQFIASAPTIHYGFVAEDFIDGNNHFLKLPESFYVENNIQSKK